MSRPGKKLSVLEQRRLEEALVRQKENIVQKQVVAGREFSGPGFVSKPAQIIFTDYDMGKVYRQRITLTNVSYSVNSFQLLPTPSEEISYEYTPSGGLSPGLSIDLVVVFEPKLMRDLDTKMELLAQTGPFAIPLKCTRKRCEPHLSAQHLDFGQIFMGESASKNLTVRCWSQAVALPFDSLSRTHIPLTHRLLCGPPQAAPPLCSLTPHFLSMTDLQQRRISIQI